MRYWKDETTGCIMREPNCAEEWCSQIWEVGFDYDGCDTVESLKNLIDELVEMALSARDCIYEGKISLNTSKVRQENDDSLLFCFQNKNTRDEITPDNISNSSRN